MDVTSRIAEHRTWCWGQGGPRRLHQHRPITRHKAGARSSLLTMPNICEVLTLKMHDCTFQHNVISNGLLLQHGHGWNLFISLQKSQKHAVGIRIFVSNPSAGVLLWHGGDVWCVMLWQTLDTRLLTPGRPPVSWRSLVCHGAGVTRVVSKYVIMWALSVASVAAAYLRHLDVTWGGRPLDVTHCQAPSLDVTGATLTLIQR